MPLKQLVKKFKDVRFEPSGFTDNPEIPTAKSIIDYIFRYLGMKYLSREDREEIFGPEVAALPTFTERVIDAENKIDSILSGLVSRPIEETSQAKPVVAALLPGAVGKTTADAPICQCGTLMVRNGACYNCPNCFASSGVCN